MLSTETIKDALDYSFIKKNMHKVAVNPPWLSNKEIHQNRWNPYTMEGGSSAAIAGEDFAISVSDTRMSQFEVNILTRNAEKFHIFNDKIVLNSCGFYGDSLQLRRVLAAHINKFRFDYREDLSVNLCGELLSRILYSKRFFPYYTGAILLGIDDFGKGRVYSYDSIGTIECLQYSCSGSAEPLIQPFLDNQIGQLTLSDDAERPPLTIERAESTLKDAFRFAAERETTTGDKLCVVVAQAGKPVKSYYVGLRED